MTGQQTIVATGGLGLVVLNYWTGPNRATVAGGLFNPGGNTTAARKALVSLGGELLFVVVASVLAGISDSWGTAMVAVIVALFILWAINHYGGQTGTRKAAAA